MKIIIGLGNPGTEYLNTRHNAGLILVDKIAEGLTSEYGWRKNYAAFIFKTPDLVLIKSKEVFMNESGKLLQGIDLQQGVFYLAHDDLDLRLGEFKIQKGVGPKVHYGVQAIENQLGTKDFWRIRIGVDNRDPNNLPAGRQVRVPGEEYVLQKFDPTELSTVNEVLQQIITQLIPHP